MRFVMPNPFMRVSGRGDALSFLFLGLGFKNLHVSIFKVKAGAPKIEKRQSSVRPSLVNFLAAMAAGMSAKKQQRLSSTPTQKGSTVAKPPPGC